MPSVSIGLPVYNAENTLPKAIESIQSQSYVDYEVVVFDNCSTDNTPELLKQYALNDSRVRLTIRDRNAGPEANFRDVFHNSTGEFFTWWAADDWRSPEWIEACMQTLREDPQAIAAMPPYCFDFDIENKQNWQNYSLQGDSRLATLMDNFHLSHSVTYSLIRTKVIASWFQNHDFDAINGSDWILNLYLACKGDIPRTPHGLMIGGTNGDSRRGWLYQRTLIEVQVPLYRAYAKIDEMIQEAAGISNTQKYLACARLMARHHEVGEQMSLYWNTLDSPLIPLLGFSRLESFDGAMLVQWCHVNETEARTKESLSIALSDTQRQVGVYIYNPGDKPAKACFINPATNKQLGLTMNPGINELNMLEIRQQLLMEGYSAINMTHNFPASERRPSFGSYRIYFGIVRDFKERNIGSHDHFTKQESRPDHSLSILKFKVKCFARGLLSKMGAT